MSWTFTQSFSFIPLMASEKIFEYFFENLAFQLPWQPIKFSDLDKIPIVGRRLLQKYFCKTFFKISAVTQTWMPISTFPIISIWKLSCHSNQSFVLGFYSPVNNEVMWSLCWGFTAQSTTRSCQAGQLIVVLFLGRLRPSKRLTSTKRGRPWQ